MGTEQGIVPLWKLPLDTILARCQQLRDERTSQAARAGATRLALLGGWNTQFVSRVLDALLFEQGLDVELYEAGYETYAESILNPESELYQFRPQQVLLLVHRGNLSARPNLAESDAETEDKARGEVERWAGYWQILHTRLGCQIIQSNFEPPDSRSLGNLEISLPQGELAFTRRVNALLSERARGVVQLFDVDYLCTWFGLSRALDSSRYHLIKQPYAFEFLSSYCHALAALVLAAQGKAKKCLVLDLDDTLWGGVVGDDGVDALALGPGNAVGEAFSAFQRYLKALKDRGVLLAVCSKNDEHVARAAFAHPGMCLALDDIACFVANWQDKASNLQLIARRLNIGLDSLVFVDDNPAERLLIRGLLPQVSVVELPDDPADYVRALDEGHYFESSELSAESLARTEYLRADQLRGAVETTFTDYVSYLKSLELEAHVSPIDARSRARVAELIKRTNQFNLRTRRHSAEQVADLLQRPGSVGFSVAIADRFGSQGTVAVVLLTREADALFVDTWLMSCRVLKRGVERCVFEQILRHARAQGVERVLGEYIPSGKNAMVEGLFAELGFRKIAADASGAMRWELLLAQAPEHVEHYIRVSDR
jgi:FkbH-like protein